MTDIIDIEPTSEAESAPKGLRLPLLITRGLILFPNASEAIDAMRPYSVRAIDASREKYNSLIFVASQINPDQNEITGIADVNLWCTLARIVGYSERDGVYRIRVAGSKRVRLVSDFLDQKDGYFEAEGEEIDEVEGPKEEEQALVKRILSALASDDLRRDLPKSVLANLSHGVAASELADALASNLPIGPKEKLTYLSEPDVNQRLLKIAEYLAGRKATKELDDRIESTVRERAERSQKEYYLREKIKAIRDELGEGADPEADESSIREKIENNPYPENVKKKVLAELKRYEMMPESSLEASLILGYIQTLLNVPWFEKTEDDDSLEHVRAILDEDHYGLTKVKERIIEYLAVKKATGTLKAPILCFYGPPGCGKTSLAKSIARALGRKFYKASLGGVSDEAEIRGHRRTYVGSMPGRIIQGMTKAGVTNPVFLLDEIDKVGSSSYRGDPSSALLEVLDPEQNVAFNDNYLEEPYDLSNVLFIATANYLENVPAPLRDRLELIEVPSYTEIEKLHIGEGFLIKKQAKLNGLKDGDATWADGSLKTIIEGYTREAGVRELERLVASCSRKAVVQLAKGEEKAPIVIDPERVAKYLGVPPFEDTKKEKEPQIGVVTGLAYTEFGGDILPIEVTYFQGKGGLILTGKLGDVMKESAQIALDYVRANAERYAIDPSLFEKNDIHIHVPEGAVPKDGPSAGVAITTAIISCLSKRPVDNNVAMTGEVTLRGNALPIGGLREKSLAALRSGIKTIIVPEENKKDVSELPEEVKRDLQIVFMKRVDDALAVALKD